ncbi:hypothetical protein PCASD_09633 [Puccinia coronata f. sp. avenae]|uniref:Uncharacterized protein n=1 Tax=Puccinia coronata f. sp. avenae TaxID=200324 RepID=A0A2N5SB63_9BASI|nr:hypothetical protein PCASD_21909 [Puccinia coronata f. sp. avenae]PLW39737.1 hypothetical protein PCASD_09633 [Puccinia coronata f. sp. avenae]
MANSKLLPGQPEIYTTKTTDSSSHQAALKFLGIVELKSAGPDSNYINWKFVVGIHLQETKVSYVLTPIELHLCPDTWSQDNTAVCSVITRTVDKSNYQYICDFKDNAAE